MSWEGLDEGIAEMFEAETVWERTVSATYAKVLRKRAGQASVFGRAVKRRYERSNKGRAMKQRYERSEKGRAAQQRYERSEKRRAAKKRYRQSIKRKSEALAEGR